MNPLQLLLTLFFFISVACVYLHSNQSVEGFEGAKSDDEMKTLMDQTVGDFYKFSKGIQSADKDKISPTDLRGMSGKLNKQLKRLELLMKESNRGNEFTGANPLPESSIQSESLKLSQTAQDRELDELEKRYAKLKAVYQDYLDKKHTKIYPKIPIYSSCIISEANGDVSQDSDTVVNSETNPVPGMNPFVSNNSRPEISVSKFNPAKHASKTVGKTESGEVNWEEVLSGLTKNPININLVTKD